MATINSAVLHRCRPDWSWDTAATNWTDTDLWYIAGGEGSLETPIGPFPLQPGMLFFLSGNDRYVGSQNPERSLKVYAVHFDADKGSIPCFAVKVKDPVFYEKICMRIISAQEGEDSVQAEQWLAAALQEARASLDSAGFGLSSNKNMVSRIRERLRSIEGEPVTVKDMSRWFGSSRAHFGRIFKRETGLTPQEYLIARRIDRASILLSSTGYSLGRIAEITGYSDIFFFSRQFKAKTGICPSEFRKNPSRRRISHCL